ncbi:MAG: hypothetical protein V3V30_00845 [Parvularculaceae bacterium]
MATLIVDERHVILYLLASSSHPKPILSPWRKDGSYKNPVLRIRV